MKFEIEVPKGVKWLAQDSTGAWWGFNKRPIYGGDGRWDNLNAISMCICNGIPPEFPEEELYEIKNERS